MKNQVLLTAVIILHATSFVFSQDEKTVKQNRIQDVSIQNLFSSSYKNVGSLSDFKILAPQSLLLNNLTSEYILSNGQHIQMNPQFSISLGIALGKKNKSNSSLRLGLSSFSESSLGSTYFKENVVRFDTITSSQTGQSYYLDSSNINSYTLDYSSKQIRLNASYIFRANPEKRWSFFGGIGFNAGISYNSTTDIYALRLTSTNNPFGSTNYNSYSATSSKTEHFKNKTNVGFCVFAPIGINFRIAKKNEFWQKIHLFYELRPSMNFMSIPELSSFVNLNIQHGFGVRYVLK